MTTEPPLSEQELRAETAGLPPETAEGGLVRAAGIIAVGNVASRVLGLGREAVIAYLFGAAPAVSLFRVAGTLVQTLYDLLIGGMVSAALVPVFSEFAGRGNRGELWRVSSVVLTVVALGLALAVLLLELFAPQLVWILGGGYDPGLQETAVGMIRLVLPAVFFLGLSGIITGLLYALKRFTFPAFAGAAYNAGIVLVALVLSPRYGIQSLILGVLVGSAVQVAFQVIGLRDMHWQVGLNLRHPVLLRILRLYLPVLAGLGIGVVGVAIDRNLASFTSPQALAWMQNATVLVQLPLGLVAAAVSFAILPQLSRQPAEGKSLSKANRLARIDSEQRTASGGQLLGSRSQAQDADEFRRILAFGIKLVLLLVIPAAVGLFVLAEPAVALIFEHGAFTRSDTAWTAAALRIYLVGLPFAAIDQPLVFAFYARKNTLAPNLVAFIGVGIYLLVAWLLIKPFGMLGLVAANAAQLSGHALVMIWLTYWRLGGLGQNQVAETIGKVLLASTLMGSVAFWLRSAIVSAAGSTIAQVLGPGIAAAGVYLALLRLLRVRESDRLWASLIARVRSV
jgi:putative peptidoglycan lipid II flippase